MLNWRVCLTGVARADHLRCCWAGATTGSERLAFAYLIWRQQLDDGLMQSVIRGAQLNAYLPVTPHEKITGGTEVAFPIGLQVHGIGAHIHIQDRGVEGDTHVGDGHA